MEGLGPLQLNSADSHAVALFVKVTSTRIRCSREFATEDRAAYSNDERAEALLKSSSSKLEKSRICRPKAAAAPTFFLDWPYTRQS